MAEALNGRLDCFLCGRPLGRRIEWHHPVPKSRGGRETQPVHPICHRTIHAVLTNRELAALYSHPAALRGHPKIARFIDWVSDKPPDFHAPTRRRRP
ncbi:HNH endonuclease [Sphingosinicella sp. CPCC 101087]|uniref:HNH endonuclease n=1 Tax=Sphingosinicella sp. CPCC 101087 TaxID=2497754 RepID=UPI00101DDB09|nr:HNH endonuclease [Sphingosinicella sp. CPCC 101087]